MIPRVSDIGFIRRKLESGDIYFLANTGNQARDVEAAFRVKNLSVERWDPFTGTKLATPWKEAPDGRIIVPLHLEPYESKVLKFTNSPDTPASSRSRPRQPQACVDMGRDWKVGFPGTGKSVRMDRLGSWTDLDGVRFYSGQAVYQKTLALTDSMLKQGERIYLNFGEGVPIEPHHRQNGTQAWIESPVREAAVVYINGYRAGSVWCPPYELEITTFLHSGTNDFRIVVRNLAINEMAGKSLPDYRLLYDRCGKRFDAQDMNDLQPLPSGLLGPISLVTR